MAVLLALGLLALAACGGEGSGSGEETAGSDGGTPKVGGHLVVGTEADYNGFLPGREVASNRIMYAIYDPLMSYDSKGELHPYLAESLTGNATLDEFTLKLRPNVKFHDGTPLNAAAIKEIFDKHLKIPASRVFANLTIVDSLRTVDDLTVVYKLTTPNAAFPGLLAGVVGMPFSPTAATTKGDALLSSPVGTGPFTFESWQRDSHLIVKKNPNYWQPGLPYLDQITYRPIPDEDSRLASLLSGEIDTMLTVRQAQNVAKAAKESGGRIKEYPDIGNQVANININMQKPPMSDKRVRRAMGYAVKQEELISVQGLEGIAPVTTQLFAKDSPFYSEQAAKVYAMNDVPKARALATEYMNDPSRSDGKPVGSRINLGQFTCTAGVSSLNDLVLLYQGRWKDVGIDIELSLVDQTVLSQRSVGQAPDFKAGYDVTCTRGGSDEDPDVLYNSLYDVKAAANSNDIDNAEVKRLLDLGRRSGNPEERRKIYQDLMVVLAEEMPKIYHGGLATTNGAKAEVKNIPGWVFPDGTKGDGTPSSIVRYSHVWLDR
ncbi:MAG: ABC transporter, substrate-binding protein (cluster 5, nickel/peptides/opines) [uncultured Acidimicrobiales bacterium]|uniref:ABC transporter, substrate-binding protein (Cluster 5, nickel/peptides/opines) n=1 Tax=uncultured Acidimicrobiales bacterium TaxID=310071 RepID=A0A6J4IG08_9ACTN|nr:MAG: ABC transporter, substrate-binding protein (cluster 5, nickel/peptides/opines) [uncultured Acidimicrobiales bacterium]